MSPTNLKEKLIKKGEKLNLRSKNGGMVERIRIPEKFVSDKAKKMAEGKTILPAPPCFDPRFDPQKPAALAGVLGRPASLPGNLVLPGSLMARGEAKGTALTERPDSNSRELAPLALAAVSAALMNLKKSASTSVAAKILEQVKPCEENPENDKGEDMLLHCCCGPCAEYPILNLAERGFMPHLYFYNPNIHPQAEWQRRFDSMKKLADMRELPFYYSKAYMQKEWMKYRGKPSKLRCAFCYINRLDEAAQKARSLKLASFTTSLLVSPYQNREMILKMGRKAAAKWGVSFREDDYRPGFRLGQNMAIADNLYRQKFCGCVFSLEESKFRDKVLKQLNIESFDQIMPPLAENKVSESETKERIQA